MGNSPIKTFHCSNCNNTIRNGFKYVLNGKTLCCNCYLSQMENREEPPVPPVSQVEKKEVSPQEELYDYIKKIFKISDLPFDVISFIEREVKYERMKYKGIKYTIYYVYKILEQQKDIMFLTHCIQKYYADAKSFYTERQKINEKNKNFEFKQNNTKVVVTRDSLDKKKRKRKPKYSIEDL